MTIDERVEGLLDLLPLANTNTRCRETLRAALLEVARDQQDACGQAVHTCRKVVLGSNQRVFIELDTAATAVMNASIK